MSITIRAFIHLVTASLAVFLCSASAFAGACMERRVMQTFLTEQYHEHPVAMGLIRVDIMMELFVSETGTWSVVLTNTDGLSCINAAGTNWEQNAAAKPPEF